METFFNNEKGWYIDELVQQCECYMYDAYVLDAAACNNTKHSSYLNSHSHYFNCWNDALTNYPFGTIKNSTYPI